MSETSERRLQVFISSTFVDLIAERQAAHLAVLQLDHIPAGMELFAAGTDDAWTLITKVIKRSDVYLLIIGGRYGSTDAAGLGFTEKEYELAIQLGKPIIPLLHKDPSALPRNKTEQSEGAWAQLKSFMDNVKLKHTCAFWENSSDLKAAVMSALIHIGPSVEGGWVRAEAGRQGEKRRNVNSPSEPRLTDFNDALLRNIIELDENYQRGDSLSGASTGLIDLDKLMGGLRPEEVVAIAGRPSMGSTALALRMILEIAKLTLPVVIVSASESAASISKRILAMEGYLDASRVFSGAITDEEWPRLTCAIQRLDSTNILIEDSPSPNSSHILSACRIAKERYGALAAVLIDDSQFVNCEDLPKHEDFGRFAKRLAREFTTTVITTTALPRSIEARVNKRPLIFDLPAGQSESADSVLFTYNDRVYNHDSVDSGVVEVIVAKNRTGPLGAVRLAAMRGILGNMPSIEGFAKDFE
jgi:hypothetical protein